MTTPFFTPEEKVKRCFERHPDWTASRVAKSTGIHLAEVEAIRAGLPATPQSGAPAAAGGNGNASFVTLDRVISRYDTRAAILKAIAELPKGKLILESEICQRAAGTDRNRFRRCLDNNAEELKALRIKLRLDDSAEGKWFWGHASDIAEAQKIVSL